MTDQTIASERFLQECAATQNFLNSPSEDTFAAVFKVFTPQLISFFRARGCQPALSEDLAQDVMLIVYRKADQLRDRTLFRAWLYKVARSSLCRHYDKQTREVDTIDLEKVSDSLITSIKPSAMTPAFEFQHWMSFLESREQEALTLRFIEEWEYHEIAAAKAIPIGTVQWRVFNAKKKLAPHLKWRERADKDTSVLRWWCANVRHKKKNGGQPAIASSQATYRFPKDLCSGYPVSQ
jgi:RNA polymerase sigma factor (sigma-70 family)